MSHGRWSLLISLESPVAMQADILAQQSRAKERQKESSVSSATARNSTNATASKRKRGESNGSSRAHGISSNSSRGVDDKKSASAQKKGVLPRKKKKND